MEKCLGVKNPGTDILAPKFQIIFSAQIRIGKNV